MGSSIREMGLQNVKASARNKTIAMLQARAAAGDEIAQRYLEAIQSRAITAERAFSAYSQERAQEERFNRQQAAIAGRENARLERDQATRNKTAEFLRGQGMEGVAGLVEAGLFTGPQAIQFTKDRRMQELAEQAAQAYQAGDMQKAMSILTQISPTAVGQQIAAQANPKTEILGGGKYTATYGPDGPTITVNQDVIDAEAAIKAADKASGGLSTQAAKREDEDFEKLRTLSNLMQDTQSVIELFGYNPETQEFAGPLDIGVTGFASGALGSLGLGSGNVEVAKARNEFDRFRTRFVNNSLRLNKGVQTEGDAQRAANELLTANTEETAYAAIQELQMINQRAYAEISEGINRRRSRAGVGAVDVPGMPKVPNLGWSIK